MRQQRQDIIGQRDTAQQAVNKLEQDVLGEILKLMHCMIEHQGCTSVQIDGRISGGLSSCPTSPSMLHSMLQVLSVACNIDTHASCMQVT